MTAAREVTAMLAEHEQFLAEFDQYRRTCLDATEYNRYIVLLHLLVIWLNSI